MSKTLRHLGIDIGSVSVKLAVLDASGRVRLSRYRRHHGRPFRVLRELVFSIGGADTVSVTGSVGKALGPVFGLEPVNEMVAHATAVRRLYPAARSIIEMGGEDSKLIVLGEGRIDDFSMNGICAAGTGSFLDQQAERLRMSIEEFSEAALSSRTPPRIAGRCSVFAKSDMIHLQQIATPVEDIVAGLCFAVARNFRSVICKGRDLAPPVVFQGGVAANAGMQRAFREVFGLEDLIRPEHFAEMGAIGAVYADLERLAHGELEALAAFDPGALDAFLSGQAYTGESLDPLVPDPEDFWSRHRVSYPIRALREEEAPETAYLGIDIGSISTNLAVIDTEGRVLAKRYLRTAGRPIEAVMTGLKEIQDELGGRVRIGGVGTTGSGRYMIADYVGADIVKNEITAQATAAAFIDPSVDTIFEIGGQDSKYIGLKDGVVVDFEMNKACAAGTGSFLEEQAEKLSISVKEEFADEALRAGGPCPLGERCTVFMENSLMSRLQKGAGKEDLLAGLAYSIVRNYLNRVVGERRIGRNVFFQGGTAFNKAVVAAFERVLGQKVTVPPHHDVTGAIGMALIAMRDAAARGGGPSRFRGFDLWRQKYAIRSFDCKGCDNHCEINTVTVEGRKEKLVYGGRCEKYDVKRNARSGLPNLFEERARWLREDHEEQRARRKGPFRARLGLPPVFFFNDFLPFWSRLLWELGFEVVLGPRTGTPIIHAGLEAVQAEGCFPMKVAHGHVRHLLDAGVDAVFIPSMIGLNRRNEAFSRGVACPYAQTIPYVTRLALGRYPALVPVVDFELGPASLRRELHRVFRDYGVSKGRIRRALAEAEKAQNRFQQRLLERGREILGDLGSRALVVVGRAYNAFDPALNLNIPKKLLDLDVLPIPMDFLPLGDADISQEWAGMYWRSGQRLLQAARIIREDERLFPVFITNFSCGPDSFILRFFKEKLGGKPFLQLEIDEHSADAGAVTRLEAYLDSLENLERRSFPAPPVIARRSNGESVRGRKIYIPRMCDHTVALAAAFEAFGLEAEPMPLSDRKTTEIGRRWVSGKECYPCTVTTGDMVKLATRPDFDPDRSAFMMPSGIGPCRFGQYNTYHRLVLDELGFRDVPIFAPVQEAGFYREMGFVGTEFVKRGLAGIMATDLLMKCLHETRPYERNPGESDDLYRHYLDRLAALLRDPGARLEPLLDEAGRAFSAVPRFRERKPLVGVVGEIYVRSNVYANEDLVRKIEELGGEVWLSPITEWFAYLSEVGYRRARALRNWSSVLSEFLTRRYQARTEASLARCFNGDFRTLHEPAVPELMRLAAPYIDDSFEGEAVLSVGKALDLSARGAAGVVNAMPFGCMPGTIAGAVLKAVKDDRGLPYLNLAYDGTESSNLHIQLEAFMHQVKDRARAV